mgnify:CR=1 FL=1
MGVVYICNINIDEQDVAEGENWSKHNNKRAGGMSKKSVASYRRSHPGSKIQTAVQMQFTCAPLGIQGRFIWDDGAL